MRRLFLLFSLIILGFAGLSQTSPLIVKDFTVKSNEIIDLEQIPKFNRTDLDSNPICRIRVKSVGFGEDVLQKVLFVPRGIEITHMVFKEGQWLLHVSSRKNGEIIMKYMGDCTFRLPYQLEAGKVYELTLGMETATLVIRSVPTDADIFIDNEKAGTGYASKAVSIGAEHRYKVQCEYYWPVEDVVYFDKRDKKELNINLEPNFGFITIKTEPTGADVFVDEVKVGVTPYLMKKITLGHHAVELRKTGCDVYADMVVIKAGEVNKQLENIKLTTIQVPTGTLELTSNPTGALITINGHQYGQTPLTLTDFEIGTYIIDFSKEGYQNLHQTASVKEGKKETINVTLTNTIVSQQSAPATTSFENRTFTVNGVTFEMVAVKGGTFTMGCTSKQGDECQDDEKPTHNVTLSNYYIGKYEVTVALFRAFVNETGYRTDAEKEGWVWRWMEVDGTWQWNQVSGIYWIHDNNGYARISSEDNHPVLYISWNDAQEFCSWLSRKTNQTFRLPTEAEWEYAARGGNKSKGYKYSGSNNINEVAWYGNLESDVTANGNTHIVGTKTSNELGIYDMTGNVWEWCQDWYGDYSSSSQTNPTGPSSGSNRVLRGGSWNCNVRICRVSIRSSNDSDGRNNGCGFRLVLVSECADIWDNAYLSYKNDDYQNAIKWLNEILNNDNCKYYSKDASILLKDCNARIKEQNLQQDIYFDLTYEFGKSKIENTAENRNVILEVKNEIINGAQFSTIIIDGYAPPDGNAYQNMNLSHDVAVSAAEYIKNYLGDLVNNIEFVITCKGSDWEGFFTLLESSNITNKAEIKNSIQNADDPAAKLKELRAWNPELAQLLPELRRVKVSFFK